MTSPQPINDAMQRTADDAHHFCTGDNALQVMGITPKRIGELMDALDPRNHTKE